MEICQSCFSDYISIPEITGWFRRYLSSDNFGIIMIRYTTEIYRNAYSGLSRSTWLLSVIMLINRSGTMVIPFMTLYLTSPSMGYTVGQAGFVFGLFGLGSFCGAYFGGRLTDKIGFYPIQLDNPGRWRVAIYRIRSNEKLWVDLSFYIFAEFCKRSFPARQFNRHSFLQ